MGELMQRCGFVAILGAPNAGKSTLVNTLIGEKIAIVTHKAQTTRARLRGVLLHETAQIILIDTPGIFNPAKRFERAMVESAFTGMDDADIILLVVDVTRPLPSAIEHLLPRLAQTQKLIVLVLNKIDLIAREKLLSLAQNISEQVNFAHIFMVSAKTGDGLSELAPQLAAMMPQGAWLYPEDQAADMPLYLMAAEITREKLFLRLHQELPYELTVETEKWQQQTNAIRIEQVIYVRRASQKSIVLGKGGRMIKDIGEQARTELQDIMQTNVHLFLFVKQRENWLNDPERYRYLGLEFGK